VYPGGVAPSLNPKPVQKYGSWDGTTGEPHGAPTQTDGGAKHDGRVIEASRESRRDKCIIL